MFARLLKRLWRGRTVPPPSVTIDFEQAHSLDAENLAEQGIAAAYRDLLPELRRYIDTPLVVVDVVDEVNASYAVRVGEEERVLYSPDIPGSDAESWGRTTYCFFDIVNRQLQDTSVRFYALSGGNDLAGIFLTPAQAKAAMATMPRREDWPYIPQPDAPWYGQFR